MEKAKTLILTLAIGALVFACKPDSKPKQSKQAPANQASAQTQQQQNQPPAAQQPEQDAVQEPDSYLPPPANEPVMQQQMAPTGPHAILYGQFGTKQQAEDNIRILRASRVNCFIHETSVGQYGVLVGPFRNYNEASKQMGRLQERGIDNLTVYQMEK